MNAAGISPFGSVQHLVLRASRARAVRHQVVRFESAEGGRRFIAGVMTHLRPGFGVTRPGDDVPQVALGLSIRGLEVLNVPDGYLHVFRRLSPPFAEGAPSRATRQLGDVGHSAPQFWDPAFSFAEAHAIVTVHGSEGECVDALKTLEWLVETRGASLAGKSMCGQRLSTPPGHQHDEKSHWVHFGYRDGLTNPVVIGAGETEGKPDVHCPGELLLGEPRDLGDNPWNLAHLPEEVRQFFRHGSFGVLRRIEQKERVFRDQVARWAMVVAEDRGHRIAQPLAAGDAVEWPLDAVEAFVRAKLCGRWPGGQVVRPEHGPTAVLQGPDPPESSFDFRGDPHGAGCPFGAHIRRMNPRSADGFQDDRVVHLRPRPLFRRGMPYGPWFNAELEKEREKERGLLGLFFCADLADQFEHLLGEWADRLPLGFQGDRHGKDPLIGAHADPRARFLMPRRETLRSRAGETEVSDPWPLDLHGFRPFVQTRGTVYAFYPTRETLCRLAAATPTWLPEEDPWLVR